MMIPKSSIIGGNITNTAIRDQQHATTISTIDLSANLTIDQEAVAQFTGNITFIVFSVSE